MRLLGRAPLPAALLACLLAVLFPHVAESNAATFGQHPLTVFAAVGEPDGDGDGTPDAEDCAPADPAVHPGAVEVVGNGIDDDCDPATPDVLPDTVFDATPAAVTSLTSVSFSFHATVAGIGFECELDGGGFSACTSPVQLSGLSIGAHTFAVRAVGDPTPATFVWAVLAIPDTDIDDGPANGTSSGIAEFTFHASTSGVVYECALDGTDYQPCTSPHVVGSLSVAVHVFLVRAVNAAQTADPTPASHVWAVLTPPPGPPDTSIVQYPDAVTQSTDAAFVFGSDKAGAIFLCVLDGAPELLCSDLPRVGIGTHTVVVRAVNAGTPDPTPARYSWTVVPPDTVIDSTPASPTTASGAVFTFHSTTSPVTFQCSRDGADFTSCASGQILTGLGVGLHHFEVRARNATGDVDPVPAAADWLVVAAAPPTTPTTPVGGTSDPGLGVAPTRPAMSPTQSTSTTKRDPCAGKKSRALKLCRAEQTLKTALTRCGKLKSKMSRTRCTTKARAVRRCASLSGRKERSCRTKAGRLKSR